MTNTLSSDMSEDIDGLMKAYYTEYYRDQLGLPDWQKHVTWRLKEEDTVVSRIQNIEIWFNENLTQKKSILVVGGGTGAEFIALSKRGCDVHAIEPNSEAVKIARLKANQMNINSDQFMLGYGEKLPFEDETFEFVWCFTVLEHVQNVLMCIAEMVRVTKPGGRIFIMTPDYRQFYEPHYKITLPLFLPKSLLKLYIRLLHRPTEFLDTLQFVNSKQLVNIFQNHPVVAFQIIHPWPKEWQYNLTFQQKLTKWMIKNMGIQRDQYWVLQKLRKYS